MNTVVGQTVAKTLSNGITFCTCREKNVCISYSLTNHSLKKEMGRNSICFELTIIIKRYNVFDYGYFLLEICERVKLLHQLHT